MLRASALVAVLALTVPFVVLHADDDASAQATKQQSHPQLKVEPKKSDGAAVSPDRLKEILRDALKQIQSMEETAAKSRNVLAPVTMASMAMTMSKDMQAQTIAAIGTAQAKLGDLAAARSTWQIALDSAGENTSFNAPLERGALYIEIAKAQREAGEQNEARFTLRQALQSARSIKGGSLLPFEPAGGIDFDSDPLAKKTEFLRRIAEIQAAAGDGSASQETMHLAADTADSLTNPFHKVRALLEIAQTNSSDAARAVWAKALDFALSQKEEYPRAQAVEMVIRARLKALPVEETLTLVADRFQGDFQHYALWVVADEIAGSDKPVPPSAMQRLYQLAQKAEFDRPSKKVKVFQRIAEAQARLGDLDGAYRAAGEPHPVNDIQNFRATQARAYVMKAIAEAQLKAKHRDAARDTVLTAIEMFAPLPDEDAEAYFPLADLCLLQAKAGDLAGALHTLGAVSSSTWKVHILAEIAVGHAEAGRQADAQKTIRMAFDASRRAPNDALWATLRTIGLPAFARGADPMSHVLQLLAHAQARIGDLDGAQKTLADISSSGFGKYTRSQTIAQIIGTRLDAADLVGARHFAELLPDDENPYVTTKSALLGRIARQQAKKGDVADVLDWAAKEKLPGSRLHLLQGLAEGIVDRVTPPETKAADSRPQPSKPN